MANSRLRNVTALGIAASLLLLSATTGQSQDFGSQQPPPPPTNLTAKYIYKEIALRWNEVATPNVVEYRIFRYDNSDPNKAVSMVAADPKNKIVSQHAYIDKTAIPGHSYTYFVTAKNQFGLQSVNSKMAAVVKGYK
jgi:fibronectin type 3 domain-containing protein